VWEFGVVALLALASPVEDARAQGGAAVPGPATPGVASSAPAAAANGFDVEKLFANTCGWCHSNAGRTAGRGPQLMGTTLTDAEIIHRIKTGKTGAMPSFAAQFDEAQLQAIVRYIRGLKDEGNAK